MSDFINPYNFVPLEKEPPERGKIPAEGELYTGRIEYTIKTLSPLFIPNTSNDRALGVKGKNDTPETYHKSYDFFSYHDLSKNATPDTCYEPVLPGSEIRGMVRSVYEAMTNSCLSAVEEDVTLSKRTPEYFTPGVLLKNGDGYKLHEATDYLYRKGRKGDFTVHSYEDLNLPDGSHVYFTAVKRNGKAKPIAKDISSEENYEKQPEGYLIKGEPGPELSVKVDNNKKCASCPMRQTKCKGMGKKRCYRMEKHCAHVFEIDKKKKPYLINKAEAKDIRDRMDKLLLEYTKNSEKEVYREYKKTWEDFKNSNLEGIAVYYYEVGGIHYLSPACITREVYKNTLGDILRKHRACSKEGEACSACRLFGAVNNGLRIASGLRFSDAYVKEKRENAAAYYDKVLTLPELSQPKLASTEFYLKRPNEHALRWTYDYYLSKEKNGEVTFKAHMPEISGRKFYWHSPETAKWVQEELGDAKRIIRNKTVRPLKAGVTFQGELYFDEITKEQLDELIAILNISALEKEDKYALKLGSAKPLGFGSVALKVERAVYRTVSPDPEAGLLYKADNSYDHRAKFTEAARDTKILKILDTQALNGSKVHYPVINMSNPEEGFVWFAKNRGNVEVKAEDKTIKKIAYYEYMFPLEPKLRKNPSAGNAGNYNNNSNNNRNKR